MSGKQEQAAQADPEKVRDPIAEQDAKCAMLAGVLTKLKLVSEEEAAAQDFDPIDAAARALVDLKRATVSEKAQKTRARNEVNILQMRSKPRKLGPVKDQLKTSELYELLSETETVELAFSDGAAELVGIPAVEVPGSAFTFRRQRLGLNVPDLTVRGPADERGPRALMGYAVLIEGDQVAWIPRLGGQLTLGAGTINQLKDDVSLV